MHIQVFIYTIFSLNKNLMTVVISHFVDVQITSSKTKCFPFNYFVKQTAVIPKIGK
jgi:hypothetical protein